MENRGKHKKQVIQGVLLVVTLITTTLAGAEWMYGKSLFFGDETLTFAQVVTGLYFSIPFLGILSVHEFGHYFTARIYKVSVTLPYYIPMWLGFIGIPTIGTMGAFIRIKGGIRSRKHFFDIGLAGPLAGFVVALGVILYGFTHLPPPEYIFEIHPEYQQYGLDYAEHVYKNQEFSYVLGDNLVFLFFEHFVADPALVPNQYEMYHYPWLFAGYLALFFTALNLIPIGQLDGGHVLYGFLGTKTSRLVSRVLFLIMVTISGIGLVPLGELDFSFAISLLLYGWFLMLTFHHFEKNMRKRFLLVIWIMIIQMFANKFFPLEGDYGFYLFFSFLIGRFLGVDHPRALDNKSLSPGRKILGWITLAVFVISFTPRPLYIKENKNARKLKEPGHEVSIQRSAIIARRVIEIF